MNDITPEYRVDLRVKNNWLLRRMAERGMRSGADLARAAGINISTACQLIGLKRPPIGKNGQVSPSALKVCQALDASPGELWPPQHLEEPLKRNSASVELTSADVGALLGYEHAPSPERLLLDASGIQRGIDGALENLKPREREVIARRFGLEGHEPQTLEQVGKAMGVTRERIRQFEIKALRRARSRLYKQHHVEGMADLGLDSE